VTGERRPLLALTLGEPAGIGPDITIAAWLARRSRETPPFIHVGDADVLRRRAAALGQRLPIAEVAPEEAPAVFDDALPSLPGAPPVRGAAGALDGRDAEAVIEAIRTAVLLVRESRASAVVTNPIHKKALMGAGFGFPGHTEYLGALAHEFFGVEAQPVMMLAAPMLRVVPVTIHIPLSAVPGALTTELIVATVRIAAGDLKRRFGLRRPRLALSGLNPHAGEAGVLGPEDEAVIRPAVDVLRASGIDAAGPLPADTMFHEEARRLYDAAVCMYHDQALIPVKALAFDEAVNVTLGLPFVRTSPDHGTALDIAGTGRARPSSLIAALKLAARLAANERAV